MPHWRSGLVPHRDTGACRTLTASAALCLLLKSFQSFDANLRRDCAINTHECLMCESALGAARGRLLLRVLDNDQTASVLFD